MAAAVGIGRFAYTPLLPAMQEALGFTVAQAGDVASANFLGYMVGALASAGRAERPTRRGWLLAGMMVSAATTAAGALAVSFPAWALVRFLSGVASAFCLVLSTAVVIEFLAQHSRAELGALHFAGVGGGIALSVLGIELARGLGFSPFGQWGVLGGVSLVLLAAAWTILRALPAPVALTGRAAGPAAEGTPPSRFLTRLIAAYGLFGFGYVVTATFIVAMARRLDHAGWLEPLTWMVVGVLAAPSVLVWQRVAGRLSLLGALRLAYGLEAVGVLLAGFASGHVAVVAGGALLGGTFMGITALGLMAGREAGGASPGRAIGWMTSSFGFGQVLGPAVAGRLAQTTHGFELPSVVAAALLAVGIALLRRKEGA